MARKRRKRRVSRSKQVSQGKRVLASERDDKIAATALSEIFTEHEDVLDATDLNEAFNYFELKQSKKEKGRK